MAGLFSCGGAPGLHDAAPMAMKKRDERVATQDNGATFIPERKMITDDLTDFEYVTSTVPLIQKVNRLRNFHEAILSAKSVKI